ncbi:putative UDP-glucuronate:xylan alpha-glucuronosyltransferase 4, partial [Morus notabilis]|uniref:putative UDP-glucuronate:xylan alpha-glucuronosyltransferase 4 n=1 Tax=Morus notabilis TaxID=981085 RepID=UPI000CED7128
KERWQSLTLHSTNKTNHTTPRYRRPRYAYATVLHSLEAYVCGAIVLAQSIRRTNSTKDLVLLADTSSLSLSSLHALRSAGWDVLPIHRIHSPFAAKGAYNEWNYSKLRIFQLTEYDKIIFIDSDLVVLNNLDRLFIYPPLSAAANDKFMFNSGVMVIEPSLCLFETLMRLSFKLESYNGGDQGFLNEVFTWWHRLPKRINTLKIFRRYRNGKIENDHDHLIPEEVDAIHYLGLKPWMCYKDYDCNWDKADHRIFASDAAHRRWWEVYDGMPEELQAHCGLTRKMDARIKKWRGIARKEKLHGGRWKVKVKDPRQHHYIGGS